MKPIFPVLSAVLCLAAGAAAAQDAGDEFARGQAEYMAACAACHGENADGKGPLTEMFHQAIPDLTGIAARNDGVFPTLAIFQIIDGRTGVRAHGYPMPEFGGRYKAEIGDAMGPYGAEGAVRARILELVYYLQSIQQPMTE
jgi:mono/diheme cytochrome c family protein